MGVFLNPYAHTLGGGQGTVAAGAGPDGTQNYVEVTVASSQVSSTLTNFPTYVDLADLPAAFFTGVQSDGGDIRVTESDGTTRAPVDLVAIDTGASTGELHFLASSLSATSDTTYRIYYNATSTQSQPVATATYGRNAVWTNYAAVYHGDDGTDSTGNGNTLSTGAGTPTFGAAGKMGDAFAFDPGDHLKAPDSASLDITGDFTLSAWGNLDAFDALTTLISKYDTGTESSYYLALEGADKLEVAFAAGADPAFSRRTADVAYTSGMFNTWKHYVGTADVSAGGSGITLYDDGAVKASTVTKNGATTVRNSTTSLRIGDMSRVISPFYWNWNWDGEIDEVRIQAGALSADWIASEHTNQDTPTTFYTIGTEQAA